MYATKAERDCYPAISRCYRQWGEKAKCGKLDHVYTLSDDESAWVGAARILPLADNAFLLRNLTIAPSLRGRGYARQLMQSILQDPQIQPLYCYALDYLREFYLGLGFCEMLPSEVPKVVADPYCRYRANGKSFILLGFGAACCD
ncbi:GNAT family N-acetyltransferase [Gilvimarinus agarilyticus]|uniref:GNAT family N-acetyltransferase n=1 Tax=Gilvimarinus sp. 2_MG-2023 TaxID=3062666 RepID=UPI001C086741|nr:GNAT family N-acetyltransferase [Gilvimarinus sp. 2_MG-2023]MBU2885946.1 GNAT family N-acetyltransferase [Gilvimarinus agarilyticus]MDO6570692.1 GNAT family N-acetyltransferase [Gilvimarinus sp. 2_MG-2023]